MLVIRRHAGQSIRIGQDVEIEIIECAPHRVKVGIRAPKEISVMRGEVQLTRDQNLAASRSIDAAALAGVLERLARKGAELP
jgi:carbon storage regulator